MYYDTLAGTVEAIVEDAVKRELTLHRPSEVWDLCRDHLAYGTTRRGDFKLETIKGKPTGKFFHATIYRISSGRYELTTYIL